MSMLKVEARIHIKGLAAKIVREAQTQRRTDRVIANPGGWQAWRLRVPERVLDSLKRKKKRKGKRGNLMTYVYRSYGVGGVCRH